MTRQRRGARRRGVAVVTVAAVLALLAGLAAPARADDATSPDVAVQQDSTAEPTPPATEPPVEPAPIEPTSPPTDAPTEPPPSASALPLREGATGWRVAKVQERLQWLGYDIFVGNLVRERMGASTVEAVRKFQVKFGIRPSGTVTARTYERLADISGKVGVLPKGCLGQLTICIDKRQRLVRLIEDDLPVLTLDARFGYTGAETREGTFRVHFKSRDHTSSLYQSWMPFALFFAGGQAVHYSAYFARDGYNGASHGCVNLRDYKAAKWLFDQVPTGTRVHVYRS